MSPRQCQYGPVEWHRLAQTRCHEKHGDGRYDPGQWSHLLRYLVPAVALARWRRLLTLTTLALLVVRWLTHGTLCLTIVKRKGQLSMIAGGSLPWPVAALRRVWKNVGR